MRTVIVIVLNTLVSLALGALTVRYVSPFWGTSIFDNLMTHVALFAATLGLIAFVLGRGLGSAALVLLALLLAGHSVILKRQFAIEPTAEERATGPVFRMVSFNMLGENYENATRIADHLMELSPDVAVVLEAGPLLVQLTRLEAVFPYRIGCGERTPTCDLLLLSRHALHDTDVATLSGLRADRFMSAKIDLAGRSLHVVAAHASKPYFDAYHENELRAVKALIGNDPGPLVLAGDFNAATVAPDMQKLVRDLNLRTVPREPGTWPTSLAPLGLGIAIDHIYSRPPLIPLKVERLSEPFGSNHFGLFAEFTLRQPS